MSIAKRTKNTTLFGERSIICKHCGKVAIMYSSKALYCGRTCRYKHNYNYEKNKPSRKS